MVLSCLNKSIVARYRKNVCNRPILPLKALEQVSLVIALSCLRKAKNLMIETLGFKFLFYSGIAIYSSQSDMSSLLSRN